MADDLGTILTDKRMKALDKRLNEIYTEAYKTAVENNVKAIKKLSEFDEAKYPGLTSEQLKLKRLAYSNEILRTTKLKEKVAAELAETGKTAAGIIRNETLSIYGLNYEFSAYSIDHQADVLLDWTIYDRNQLKALMTEEQSPFTKMAYNNLGKDKIITNRLTNALTQSIILGEGQQKIIKRIREVTGQSAAQARRVAQTERVRVASQGRQLGINEAVGMGIPMDKRWLARMVRTRETHAAQDGQIVADDETFSNGLEYPGDPNGAAEEVVNCHCYLQALVRHVPDSVREDREKFDRSMGFAEGRENKSETYMEMTARKRKEATQAAKYDKFADKTRKEIKHDYNLSVNQGQQDKHIIGTNNYIDGRSVLMVDAQKLIDKHAGNGNPLQISRGVHKGAWNEKEWFEHSANIGYFINEQGNKIPTNKGIIHYSKKKGTHIVPSDPGGRR